MLPFCIVEKSHDLDFDLQNGKRSNENVPFESEYGTFYLMVIVIFTLYVSAYKIFRNKFA